MQGTQLNGILINAHTQEPIIGASLKIFHESGDLLGSTIIDDSGHYIVYTSSFINEGVILIYRIYKSDLLIGELTRTYEGEGNEVILDVELRNVPLQGIVINAHTQAPIIGATVEIFTETGDMLGFAVSEDSGNFHTDIYFLLNVGTPLIYKININYQLISEFTLPYEGEGSEVILEVELSNTPLHGIVRNAHTQSPIISATVEIFNVSGSLLGFAITEDSGNFQVDVSTYINEGDTLIYRIYKNDLLIQELSQVYLVKGEEIILDVQIGVILLRGIVRNSQSLSPISGATLQVLNAFGERLGTGLTDDSGYFTVDIDSIITEGSLLIYKIFKTQTLIQEIHLPFQGEAVELILDVTMDTTQLNGIVCFAENSQPVTGVKIEIWALNPTNNGDIGVLAATMTDAIGRFSTYVAGGFEDGQTLVYKIFKGTVLVQEIEQPFSHDEVVIEVNSLLYDQKVVDNVKEGDDINYMLISGLLSTEKELPIKSAIINIYEHGFRTRTLLATTTTDQFGFYTVRINLRHVVNTKVLNTPSANRSILVESVAPDGTLIASSANSSFRGNSISINLTANDASTYAGLTVSGFEHFVHQIDYITDNAPIDSIAGATNGDDEVEVIANAIGCNNFEVAEVVKSYQFASDLSANLPDLMYALVLGSDAEFNPALKYNEEEVRKLINTAIDKNQIANTDDSTISSFVDAVIEYQVEATKAIPIEGEYYTLDAVLLPGFGGDTTKLSDFLFTYNSFLNRPINEFWEHYTSVAGVEEASNAKKCIQLASLTGNQPAVIDDLLIEVSASSGIHELAVFSEEKWESRILDINNATGKICVPAVILNATDGNTEAAIKAYAHTLKNVFQNLYPLTNIRSRIEDGEPNLIDDTTTQAEVVTFISKNPEFDFRLSTIHEINTENCDLDGITNVELLKENLAPFQRLMRVAGGNPEAIVAMRQEGLKSAADVVDISKDYFATTYEEAFGSKEAALEAYNTANMLHTVATSTATHISTSSHPAVNQIPVLPSNTIALSQLTSANIAAASFIASTASFNALPIPKSYCNCKECLSMYSPAAYFTDLLNFVRKRTKSVRNTQNNDGYLELVRRRPDLLHIDLSCKNTNTVLPYVDLVNEILETHILKQLGKPNIPNSYQTEGVAPILAAHPEHVEKKNGVYEDTNVYESVYDEALAEAIYPLSLPFNLALEQTRVYYQHLGYHRYELIKKFRAYNLVSTTPKDDEISDFLILTEFLGISYKEAKIITNPNELEPWKCYGVKAATVTIANGIPDPAGETQLLAGTWNGLLTGRLDVLLQQTGIEYIDLLHLLQTDFLNLPNSNQNREVYITHIPPAHADTCNLSELKLHFSGATGSDIVFLKKLYRFVRLWKAWDLTINEWDVIFRSLNIVDLSNINNEKSSDYQRLIRVLVLSKQLNISPLYLASWWNNMDTHRYTKYNTELLLKTTSVYDNIFRDKSVINSPLDIFQDLSGVPTGTLPVSGLPSEYNNNTAIIASCCGIEEASLLQILNYVKIDLNDPVNITALSLVYALAQLSKALKLSVKDFILVLELVVPEAIFEITGTIPSTTKIVDRIQLLETIIERASYLTTSKFSLNEFYYIVTNRDKTGGALTPNSKNIQIFFEDIRATLKAEPLYTRYTDPVEQEQEGDLKQKLENIIYEKFTKEFNTSREILNLVFPDLVTITGDPEGFIYDLMGADFVTSTIALTLDAEIPGIQMPVMEYYEQYYYLARVFLLIDRWGLNYQEFGYLYDVTTQHTVGLDFHALPILGSPNLSEIWPLTNGVLMADHWLQLKSKLQLIDNDLVVVWESIASDNKEDFMTLLNSNNTWSEEVLEELIGAPNNLNASGILHVKFAANFEADKLGTIGLFNKILKIISWTTVIGLDVPSMHATLVSSPKLTVSESRKVLLAAKSKYNEAGWLKVAKPLRDELRKQQRRALTDYIIAHTAPSSGQNWRNSNDVYAWFLVDVEMEPCTMTSRLRLALSSVQLYMDRILLGIESYYQSAVSSHRLLVDRAYVQQWEAWRKWYRIWEANRKVFLYPENWVEPELRDNKSVFFEELEARLLEDELNNDNVTDAVKDYLIKLNDVARLEPVGNYYEQKVVDKKDHSIVHAFGRTYGKPNRYYYRRLEFNEWTPWEKVELDIKSEHVVPYVWNGRLHLFWITTRMVRKNGNKELIDKTKAGGFNNNEFFYHDTNNFIGDNNMPDNDAKYTTEQLEVTLNWSEYRNGRWLDMKFGSEKMLLDIYWHFTENVIWNSSHTTLSHNMTEFNAFYNLLSDNGAKTLTEFFTSRLFMYMHKDEKNGSLQAVISFPFEFFNIKSDNAYYLHSFTFPDDSNADCRVLKESYMKWNQPAPEGTYFNNQRFKQKPKTAKLLQNSYKNVENYNKFYVYEAEKNASGRKLDIGSSVAMFDRLVPSGSYKITSGSAYRELPTNFNNPMGDRFFFEDDKNIYFAYKTKFQTHFVATINSPTSTPFDLYPVNQYYPALSGVGVTTTSVYSNFIPLNATPLIPNQDTQNRPNTNQAVAIQNPAFSTPIIQAATPVQLQLSSSSSGVLGGTAVPIATAIDVYKFITFYHPQVKHFFALLNSKGMDALMDIRTQTQADTMDFKGTYDPTTKIDAHEYPKDIVYFDYKEAYASYNWELFYHIPMLIAQRLHDDQKFAEARQWYHYIFDPTCNVDANGNYTDSANRFWRFRDFYDNFDNVVTVQGLLDEISLNNNLAKEQVAKWENNPFQPHILARMRVGVYMRNTLMKYLDNLIAWGDNLFKRDTIESLNEATQLYILAYNLLGTKPKELPQRAYSAPHSYQELIDTGTMDDFSNAIVQIETLIDNNLLINASNVSNGNTWTNSTPTMSYFCVTANDKLLAYWDTIADRLFKIRNCMNIDGVVRQLPLFDPPIDPAMLVKAAAAGVDIGSVLNDISSANQPIYRYSVYVQKANEFCNDVKSLGGALLSALEKKDAEQLSLLRSGQELSVLEAMKQVKQMQLEEAQVSLETLELTKANTEYRLEYYSSREYTNAKESKNLQLALEASILQYMQSDMAGMASVMALTPEFSATAPFAIGPTFGGVSLSSMMSFTSDKLGSIAAFRNYEANRAATLGGYDRRMDEWQFQAESTRKELEQLDKQIVAAQIRINLAEKELDNQDLQIKNAKETDAFMRSKFSNKELYSWMISQISTTYFQAYQLAYDLAKRTEKAYTNELSFAKPPAAGYIQFGYWDSLKKGLMAGEKLQLDIRKMEAAYLENNKRELELSKDISLLFLHPEALIQLREEGTCSFDLAAWLFELDYPAHCYRRIKSVSISIPCVTGPYTTISCQLSMTNNKGTMVRNPDLSYKNVNGSPTYTIATSKAQHDGGLFEMSFRDERYLPFEGYGLDGGTSWILEMTADTELRQFDYNTINDVIIHVNYTAQNLDSKLVKNVKDELKDRLNGLFKKSDNPDTYFRLPCYFTIAHQFSNEYFKAFQQLAPVPTATGVVQAGRLIDLPMSNNLFPAFCQGRQVVIDSIYFALDSSVFSGTYQLIINGDADHKVLLDLGNKYQAAYTPLFAIVLDADNTVANLLLNLYRLEGDTPTAVSSEELKDIFMVCKYKLV